MTVRFSSYFHPSNRNAGEMAKTRMSSKGQVVIPKQVREAKGWEAGQAFELVDEGEGVRLQPVPNFSPTTVDEVAGCLAYEGAPVPAEHLHGGWALRERMRPSEEDK